MTTGRDFHDDRLRFNLFVPGVTQGNEDASPVQNFIFFFFVLVKIIRRLDEPKIPLSNPSGGKLLLRPSASYNELLGRVVFRIPPNIHDGPLLQK